MTKLLLIDDEESIIRVLSISLQSDGYEVLTAYNGESGLRLYDEESPDIVLTDIKMPGIDGIEVLRRIKEINPDSEVIVITGHGDMDIAIEALQHGASDFINKPVRQDALTVSLERAQEKVAMKRKLRDYTLGLETRINNATEDLRRQSEFLSKLISSSDNGIIASDEHGTIIIFNSGAERIFGYRAADVINKFTIFDIYPPDMSDQFRRHLAKPGEETDWMKWKEAFVTSSNRESIPVGVSGTLLFEDHTVIGSVGFFQDLREIKRLQLELVQSERLAAIGQTVAGVAHCVKNILGGLKGGTYVVNVALDKDDTDTLKKGWDIIQNNISRISGLALDLLTYSKEREPEFEPCFPNDIAEDVCRLMEARAQEHDIEIKQEFDSAVGSRFMDPKTIHRSLLNLVSNAIDACVADTAKHRKEILVRTALLMDNQVHFEVADNGIGMSDDVQNNLFTSFFSTKGDQGTGLGLLVTQKLVREHGGALDFHSVPGKGSTFTITLRCGTEEET